MKRRCLILLFSAACAGLFAQDDLPSIDDLVRDGAQWAQENLDEDFLRSLGEIDQAKARRFFRSLEKQMRGPYVIDMASLRQTASTILPLLESSPEMKPYGVWLRNRMDYIEVAEEFRAGTPPPKIEPGQPYRPAPNPTPDLERKTWQRQLDKRPAPTAAPPLVARLKPVFATQKVPSELVWLAEVESSFEPSARSPAGAAGLFQLMPQTAGSLGLSLRPADERLDPEKSASAAAKYLRYLHGQFKDWRLALAAYNAGEGNVRQVLTRAKARSFDQIATRLPAETQMYVPRIEATLRKRESVSLADLPPPK